MFETSGDFLNMSLAIGFAFLIFFLAIFVFYAILILRDVSKVISDIEQVSNRVSKTIVEPLKAVDYIVERAKPYIQTAIESRMAAKKKSKSKK